MTFSQFINVLYRRKFSIVLIFIFTVGFATYIGTILPKTYTASASVVLNLNGSDLVTGESNRVPTNTHANIIMSSRVGLKVVDALGLSSQQRYIVDFLKANKTGNLDINNYIAEKLAEDLTVETRNRLDLIKIHFEDNSPSFAKAVVNAYLDAYIETLLEMNNQLPERTAFWFQKEVDDHRNNYEALLVELTKYQESMGVYDLSEFEYEKEFLQQLSLRLFESEKYLSELNVQVDTIKEDLSNFADVISDETLSAIRLDLSKAQVSFYREAANLDENHPKYKSLISQISSLRSFLKSETKSAYETLLRNRESEILTIENLKKNIVQQKQKIGTLSVKYKNLEDLIEKVNEAKEVYSLAKSKLNTLKLQARGNSAEAEVSILARAVEPSTHTSPKLMKIIMLALVFGFILAIGYAMLRELLNRKIMIDDDITVSVGLPILGQLKDGSLR